MSMEELKACPFCGGDNIVVKPEDSFYYVESEFPFAKCLDCGVMIKAEKYYNTGRKGFDVTWNTRSYESDIESLQAETAKLKAKLEVAEKEVGDIQFLYENKNDRRRLSVYEKSITVDEVKLKWLGEFKGNASVLSGLIESYNQWNDALSTLREKG